MLITRFLKKLVILTATMSPAYSHDQIQHNEKQLRHFKVNHAYNQEMESKMTRLEQQMQEVTVPSAAPKYNKKEFNKKPDDVLKDAQKHVLQTNLQKEVTTKRG